MFCMIKDIVLLIVVLVLGFCAYKLFNALFLYIHTLRNHWVGIDTNDFVERSVERVLRVAYEKFEKKHSINEEKKMTYAEGMLNDVLREAGFDVKKFNVKGLLEAKKQEKEL